MTITLINNIVYVVFNCDKNNIHSVHSTLNRAIDVVEEAQDDPKGSTLIIFSKEVDSK